MIPIWRYNIFQMGWNQQTRHTLGFLDPSLVDLAWFGRVREFAGSIVLYPSERHASGFVFSEEFEKTRGWIAIKCRESHVISPSPSWSKLVDGEAALIILGIQQKDGIHQDISAQTCPLFVFTGCPLHPDICHDHPWPIRLVLYHSHIYRSMNRWFCMINASYRYTIHESHGHVLRGVFFWVDFLASSQLSWPRYDR